jgi:hypothetical protein
LDRLVDNRPGEGRHALRHRLGRPVHDRVHDVDIRGADERAASGERFVQDEAERENIAAGVEGLARGLFRRHVRDGADDHAGAGTVVGDGARGVAAGRSVVQLRQPEVGELRVARRGDQDVFGLDVAVQDAGAVRGGEAVGDACEQLERVAPVALRGVNPILERSAVDELRDEILTIVELAGVVDGDDVRMVQRRGRLRFALEPAPR